MSTQYLADQMQSLRYALRDMAGELRSFSSEFGGGKLIDSLNKNSKVQETANLISLYQLSMSRPELNLLNKEEQMEILSTIKNNIMPPKPEPVKEEPKRKGFFR